MVGTLECMIHPPTLRTLKRTKIVATITTFHPKHTRMYLPISENYFSVLFSFILRFTQPQSKLEALKLKIIFTMFSLFVDLINAPKDVVSKAEGEKRSFFGNLIDAVLWVYSLVFCLFRVGEIAPVIWAYPLEFKSICIGAVSLRLFSPTHSMGRLVHVAFLITMVYALDVYFVKPLPAVKKSHATKTVFITGANSGVGFETARQLVVDYGMNVVMGCRSPSKCAAAVNTINSEAKEGSASPLLIDLSNFDSVKQAAKQLMNQNIDVLYNNAGFVPDQGMPVNEYSLDPSFTSMHLSHYLLTELLLQANPTLRVVNTSSGTHHICAIPFAYLPESLHHRIEHNPGCVDENFIQYGIRTPTDSGAYIQAKVANVMHAVSIPLNHPHATSVAIDLGWVGTSIQPWMRLSVSPTSMKLMRNSQIGVLPSMHAILSSDEELLDGLGEGRQWSDGGIIINAMGLTDEAYSYPFWRDNLSRDRMLELGQKLWVVSDRLTRY